jgi:hypothetical protein
MNDYEFVVVSLCAEDSDLRTATFETYEEAMEYVDCSDAKCVLVGPGVLEEYT